MNSIHSQQTDEIADSSELVRTLKLMEEAGLPWEDRAAAAIDFLEAQRNDSGWERPQCERTPLDEELTFDDDPSRCEQHASQSEQHASRCEQHPNQSEPDANQSEPAPEPEPQLPRPPKFQFGVSNELYEVALDFRSYRDKRSILDRLTETQRQAIVKLLLDGYSEYEVTDLLAKAPPAGLSIQVSRAAVHRFRKRYEKQERRRNSVAFMREFKRILNAANGDDQAFLHASERLLKMRLFQITGDPNSNLETIAKLTGVITSLRKQGLAERKSNNSKPKTNPAEPLAQSQPPDVPMPA